MSNVIKFYTTQLVRKVLFHFKDSCSCLFIWSWYKRSEFGIRAALFFSAATVSGAFGGLYELFLVPPGPCRSCLSQVCLLQQFQRWMGSVASPLGYFMVFRQLTCADFLSGLDLHPRRNTHCCGWRFILRHHPRLPRYSKVLVRSRTRICDSSPAEWWPVLSGRREAQMETNLC